MLINAGLLGGALFLAYFLMRRLTNSHDKLAELHEQMARNDAQLREQMRRLSELKETPGEKGTAEASAPVVPPDAR